MGYWDLPDSPGAQRVTPLSTLMTHKLLFSIPIAYETRDQINHWQRKLLVSPVSRKSAWKALGSRKWMKLERNPGKTRPKNALSKLSIKIRRQFPKICQAKLKTSPQIRSAETRDQRTYLDKVLRETIRSGTSAPKIMDFRTKNNGRPLQKVCVSCGPGGGEKLFDPWASGRKGQECLQETWTKKFMFMLFFFPRESPPVCLSLRN